jgi:hypothetical protein
MKMKAKFMGIAPCAIDTDTNCVLDIPGWGWFFSLTHHLTKITMRISSFIFVEIFRTDFVPTFVFRPVKYLSEEEWNKLERWNKKQFLKSKKKDGP